MSQRLDQLKKLYDTDPEDPFITYGVALEHAKAQRFDEAITWLEATLKLDPHYHYAYFQKAKMLGETGEDDQARAVLDQGIAKATAANDAKALGELNELRESL